MGSAIVSLLRVVFPLRFGCTVFRLSKPVCERAVKPLVKFFLVHPVITPPVQNRRPVRCVHDNHINLRKVDINSGIIPGVMGRVASNSHGKDIQKVMVWRKF
jgi:hypothetical protein